MQVGMRLVGGEQLARNLLRLPEGVERAQQRRALRKGAEPIRVAMARNAPRGTEPLPKNRSVRLANSMTISTARDRVGNGDVTVAVGPSKEAFHAFFQEVGTTRHGPQPFAGPAFASEHRTALGIIGDELWNGIRRKVPASPGPSVGGRFL